MIGICEAHCEKIRELIDERGMKEKPDLDSGTLEKPLCDVREVDRSAMSVCQRVQTRLLSAVVEVEGNEQWFRQRAAAPEEHCIVCMLVEGCNCGKGSECGYHDLPRIGVDAEYAESVKRGEVASA